MIDAEAKSRILSPALIGFLRRRTMEFVGVCLIAVGLALTAMLFSPGRYDPSFSAFSSGDVQNWFGAIGSTIAGGLRVSQPRGGWWSRASCGGAAAKRA